MMSQLTSDPLRSQPRSSDPGIDIQTATSRGSSWRTVGWALGMGGGLLVGALLYALLVLLPAREARQAAESQARIRQAQKVLDQERHKLLERLNASQRKAEQAVAEAARQRLAARQARQVASARIAHPHRGARPQRWRSRPKRPRSPRRGSGQISISPKPDPRWRNNPLRGLGQDH